jgi:predicted dithiol-disulfide oxidoreductase (DUF899 family)
MPITQVPTPEARRAHPVVDRETWLEARRELLEAEKEAPSSASANGCEGCPPPRG